MSPARPPRVRGRTWPQRLVLVAGSMGVVGCAAAAAAAGYFGLRLAQIDRVSGIDVAGASAGEPANYLLVGTDSREGLDPDLAGFTDDGEAGCDCTDTIMVLRVDPQAKQAQILSFPRDLWVPIAGTGKSARINSAHAHGEQVLIDTIQDSFGITINHYLEIDFVGFERLVNAVGGIPMWFDAPVRDKHTGLSVPNAECQVLDGEQARKFVRSRYLEYKGDDGKWHSDGTADLGRITRQQIFIRSAVSKAVSKGLSNPVTLNELVSAGVDNLRLDTHLDAGDLLGLGRQFASFDSQELLGYSIPSDGFRTAGGAAVQRADMRAAEPILNIFRGLPPGTISPQSVDLTVLNGTGIQGQAADAAAAFEAVGFAIADVASSSGPHVARTTAFYGDGGEAAARLVGRHITGGAALVYDAEVGAGEVVVVTGADFTTIHDQLAPEGSPEDLLTTTSTVAGPTETTTAGESTTTVPETTTTTTAPEAVGYGTGEPPAGVTCG
jgi:LCP family protein required for cell wall assembly